MAFATINSAPPTHATLAQTQSQIPAIEDAFDAEPALKKRVYDAIGVYNPNASPFRQELTICALGSIPQYSSLFEDLARYTSSLRTSSATPKPVQPVRVVHDEPAAKKRKIENGSANGISAEGAQSLADLKTHPTLQFYMQDVSFAVPQRKKLTLELTAGNKYLRARNQMSKEVEFGVPLDRIRMLDSNLRLCQFCFAGILLIPRRACSLPPRPREESETIQLLRHPPVRRRY